MTDIKIDSEIPTEKRFDLKLSPEQKISPEVIDKKAERLTRILQEGITIVETGDVLNPPQIELLTASQKDQLLSQLSPKLVDLVYLRQYWEGDGKGERAYLQQLQERLTEVQRLGEARDVNGLFKWVLSQKYRFQESPPSTTSQRLEEIKWRLGGSKRRERIIAEEVGFLEEQAGERQTRLGDVERKITSTEEEKRELKMSQAVTTELEDKIGRITGENEIPDSFEELQRLKVETENLSREIKDKRIMALSLGGKVKTLAQAVYERNADQNVPFRKREEVTGWVGQVVKEEIEAVEVELQSFGKSFSETAELAKGRILSRLTREIGAIATEYSTLSKEYNQTRVGKMDAMVDQLSGLATALGGDNIDLRRRFKRDEKGRIVGIYDESIGGVLKALAEQVETGIDFRRQGIRIYDSLEEALGAKFQADLRRKPLFADQQIPEEAKPLKSYSDPETGKLFDIGAYEAVASHFLGDKANPPEGTHFRLIINEGLSLVVLEHDLSDQLSLLEIMDSELPKSGTTGKEEEWINVRNLLLISKQTGRVFDAASLLPEDYTLRYIPDTSTDSFRAEYGKYSKESSERFVQHADLITPERIAALFHEFGHQIVTTNSDVKLAQEAQDLWTKSRFQTGGASGMSKQEFVRTKKFLVADERGASARSLWLIRQLKQKGIDIGVGIEKISEFLNSALQSYERDYPQLYPECGMKFTRKG